MCFVQSDSDEELSMKGARVFRITKNRIVLLFFGGQCELFWFEIKDTIILVVKKNCFCLYV